MTKAVTLLLLLGSVGHSALAQKTFYAGGAGGVSTLSSDGRSVVTLTSAAVSLYKPTNGPLFNGFAGVQLYEYVSLQGSYFWNSNTITLTSSASDGLSSFYEQERGSSQHTLTGDILVYFRHRKSRLRPFLSVGTGFVHLTSRERRTLALRGSPNLPPARFSSTDPALRVAVGMDVALGRGWDFRYSFSETMGNNPLSERLSPAASSSLKNFKNLFGIVRRF